MDKRYQVFISSTYSDLQEERRKVIETIMQMDCIPAGMEMFPASDDEQFDFIKKVIDDCDYYILIIGGRYGSESHDGISYTEKEYDYAFNKDIPILAFIHDEIENIPLGKTDQNSGKMDKLVSFKNKVSSNRLIKYWNKKEDLPGLVALSISKAIKMYPQLGWVRGNYTDNRELLEQINLLRVEKEKLQMKIIELEKNLSEHSLAPDQLSQGSDLVELYGTCKPSYNTVEVKKWKLNISWDDIFSILGPFLFEANNYSKAKLNFENALKAKMNYSNYYTFDIDDNLFQTVKIQLLALDLINVFNSQSTSKGVIEFIQITPKGKRYLIEIKSIKKSEVDKK